MHDTLFLFFYMFAKSPHCRLALISYQYSYNDIEQATQNLESAKRTKYNRSPTLIHVPKYTFKTHFILKIIQI